MQLAFEAFARFLQCRSMESPDGDLAWSYWPGAAAAAAGSGHFPGAVVALAVTAAMASLDSQPSWEANEAESETLERELLPCFETSQETVAAAVVDDQTPPLQAAEIAMVLNCCCW